MSTAGGPDGPDPPDGVLPDVGHPDIGRPDDAESGGAESGGAESGGAESGGAESGGAESGGAAGPDRGAAGPDRGAAVLEMRSLTVRYGGVAALSRVSLSLRAGEITCVLGENGSGKSTLVAVLSGLRRHDDGKLLLAGRPVRFRSPRQARSAGVATAWQDLAIAPLLSVWRNFVLGREPTRGRWPLRRLDLDGAREMTVRAMARVGVTGLDPDQPASALRVGERHSLAIARALHFGARVLVIDEATAPLTVAQHALVLQSVVAGRGAGLAVLFVTHNPQYAHLVGDRYLLMAGGQVAGNLTRDDVDVDDLTRLMAGGDELAGLTASLRAQHPDLHRR